MNKEIIVFQPEVYKPQLLSDWDYDKSITKVKRLVYKWKKITPELYKELIDARENLSQVGNPNWKKNSNSHLKRTWSSYCEDIGSSRQVINHWIALWKVKKLREDKKRKFAQLTDHYDVEIRHGDFREVLEDIEDQSVDCILTDPPYGKEHLPLWDSLGEFSSRVLKKDGLLITYSGQMYLPEIISSLHKHLDWWWLCGVIHKGSGNLTPLGHPVRKVINEFKPVLIFFPKEGEGSDDVFRDLIEGTGPEKDMHNWQQPVAEARLLLETFCEPDDLIVDPFAGSGGFGEAARQLGMKFIGAEILDG